MCEMSIAEMIEQFHRTFIPGPLIPNRPDNRLRLRLHQEEYTELTEAIEGGYRNRDKIARELADVVYVAYGTALVNNIDLDVSLGDAQDNLEMALGGGNPAEIGQALSDLIAVCRAVAKVYAIDLDEAVKAVHESNMSKLGDDGKPVLREDGKVLKGPNFVEPDMALSLQSTPA